MFSRYTRALEERVTFLEGKLNHSNASPVNHGVPGANSLWPTREGQTSPQTTTPSLGGGLDNNPVGEIVGLLALSSSEAPAYVGASSGLSLAANLGEMVQTSVWNQFISRMNQKPRGASKNTTQNQISSVSDQSQPQQQPSGGCSSAQDRSMNVDPPNDEIGTKILETYFTRLHFRYPFLDRTQTWRLHEDRWRLAKTKRDDLTQPDRYAIFKLNLLYAIGSTMLQLSDNKKYAHTPPEVSRSHWEIRLPKCLPGFASYAWHLKIYIPLSPFIAGQG